MEEDEDHQKKEGSNRGLGVSIAEAHEEAHRHLNTGKTPLSSFLLFLLKKWWGTSVYPLS